MDKAKALSMLGLARRAGKLSMGHDMAENAVKHGKAKLIVFASDVSPRLVNEFKELVQRENANNIEIQLTDITINEFHFALGYKAGVITVDDENFSNRINELLN